MGDVKQFTSKEDKMIEDIQKEIEFKIDEAIDSGFIKLAMQILKLQDNDVIKWRLELGQRVYEMRTKLIYEYEQPYALSFCINGGFSSIIWIYDRVIPPQAILPDLLQTYTTQASFAGFIE